MTTVRPTISVLICTWNRPDGLRAALAGLTTQRSLDFEVIVVDNNSTDNTREVVETLSKSVPYPLTYILETRAGKCWALNTGIAACAGGTIACLDDDCVPAPDWLAEIADAFADPNVSLLGGPCLSVFSDLVKSDPYRLFLANRFLGDFAPYDKLTELADKNLPLGMNLAFRREAAEAVNGFDTRLGPRPGVHLGREETGFIRAAQSQGLRVFYTPKAVVYHHIEDKRVSWESLRRQGYFSGMGICRERWADAIDGPVPRKLLPSLIFLSELAYSQLRVLILLPSHRRSTVARFRAAAAMGKLGELWSRRGPGGNSRPNAY